MIGGQLGSYRVESELGVGGMGTVYLARDPENRKVALKVVHPHLVSLPNVQERFEREAEMGKQVVSENVVRTLDVGSAARSGETDAHFLVMEYVEGQTLRELLAEMEVLPEELCRHVGREVAKALDGIHAAGIIHRDLKPENVLITPDHVVKVMDLGLARVRDEAFRLSLSGQFSGSVQYAAPEQILRGVETLDGRADLYALGVSLYELATGRQLFFGGDLPSVMHKQLNEPPQDPLELNPQLTPFFGEFLLTLLHKDRDERFASARAVLEALEQGEDSKWWQERSGEIARQAHQPLRRMQIPRETALYGREEQIEKLLGIYEKGGVVLLQGEAGVGKTRIVDELVVRLRERGEDFHFLFGGSPPGGAATDAGAFVQVYEPIRPRLEELLAGSPLLPAFEALLGGGSTPAGIEPLSKEALQTVIVRTTHALADEKPTIILIDDLHFAPEEGRALFASLAAALREHRVLLIGTLRPGLPEEWLGELQRLDHVTLMEVGRLGPKHLQALLVEALNSPRLAEQLGAQIAAKSDGNPFFIFEILQGLRADGLIRRERGSYIKTTVIKKLTVPSSLRDLIRGRTSGLAEEDRTVLDVAACAGFEFDPTLVGEVLGLARIPLLRQLGRLEKKNRLVRAAGRHFRFDNHQVQELLYEELGELLREEYHAALADVLEPKGGDPVALAEHFLKGGQGDRALPYVPKALKHLEQSHRNSAAIDLADRALRIEGLLSGSERATVLEKKANPINVLGHYDEAIAVFQEMREEAERAGDLRLQLRAGIRIGNLLVNIARYDDAVEICEEVRTLAREHDARSALVGGSVIRGNALMYQGMWEECQKAYEEAVAVPGEFRNPLTSAGRVGNLGWARACAGRYREALELSDDALEQLAGHAWGYAFNMGYRITYFRDLGMYESAQKAGEEVLRLTHDSGYRWGEATALHELGAVAEETAKTDLARELYLEALEIRREIGYAAGTANTLAALGRLDDDHDRLREAVEIAQSIGTPTPLVVASAYLGEDATEWMPRARRREAIEAAFVSDRVEAAREMLDALDVPEGAKLDDVPVYRDVTSQ